MKNPALKFNEFYIPLSPRDAAKVAETGLQSIGETARALKQTYVTAYSRKDVAWSKAWQQPRHSMGGHSAVVLTFAVSDMLHWIIGLEPGSQIALAKTDDTRAGFSEAAWWWIAHGSRVIPAAPFALEFNNYSMRRDCQAESTLFMPLSPRQMAHTVKDGLIAFYRSPTAEDPHFVEALTDETTAKSKAILIADSTEGGACPTHLQVEIDKTTLNAFAARRLGVPILDCRRDKELFIAGDDWLLLSKGAPGCPPARYTIKCNVSALGQFQAS